MERKVALLGDSIRLYGYGRIVPALLQGKAEVFQPQENCKFAKNLLRMLFDLKSELKHCEVIHFNCGLWDVADIVGENGVIEIHTRNFGNLLEKLDNFLEFCEVTVVYPLPALKYVSWLDMDTGELGEKHKSPKKWRIYDAFREIIRIKYALDNPRFHLLLCFLEIDEIRYLNGWSKDKKRGSSRCDRIPKDIIEEVRFDSVSDYRRFLPGGLPQEFTSAHYAKACKIDKKLASSGLNILHYLGLVERIGKKGNSYVYKVVEK